MPTTSLNNIKAKFIADQIADLVFLVKNDESFRNAIGMDDSLSDFFKKINIETGDGITSTDENRNIEFLFKVILNGLMLPDETKLSEEADRLKALKVIVHPDNSTGLKSMYKDIMSTVSKVASNATDEGIKINESYFSDKVSAMHKAHLDTYNNEKMEFAKEIANDIDKCESLLSKEEVKVMIFLLTKVLVGGCLLESGDFDPGMCIEALKIELKNDKTGSAYSNSFRAVVKAIEKNIKDEEIQVLKAKIANNETFTIEELKDIERLKVMEHIPAFLRTLREGSVELQSLRKFTALGVMTSCLLYCKENNPPSTDDLKKAAENIKNLINENNIDQAWKDAMKLKDDFDVYYDRDISKATVLPKAPPKKAKSPEEEFDDAIKSHDGKIIFQFFNEGKIDVKNYASNNSALLEIEESIKSNSSNPKEDVNKFIINTGLRGSAVKPLLDNAGFTSSKERKMFVAKHNL